MQIQRMTLRRVANRSSNRNGLAPLELTLGLPILLFVMALIINFGTVAAWKIRAQSAAHYAGSRTLEHRTGSGEANPPSWSVRNANLSGGGGGQLSETQAAWDSSGFNSPAILGPGIGPISVRRRWDMGSGTHRGRANLERDVPMLRTALLKKGRYNLSPRYITLNNAWKMFPANRLRLNGGYGLGPEFFAPSEKAELDAALDALIAAELYDLSPLDRDVDFYSIAIARRLGTIVTDIPDPQDIPEDLRRVGIPDFHPRAPDLRTIDPDRVQNLIDQQGRARGWKEQIQRLPGRMGRSFQRLYQGEIARLKKMIEDRKAMVPPQEPPAGIDDEILRLEELRDQVKKFNESLPERHK